MYYDATGATGTRGRAVEQHCQRRSVVWRVIFSQAVTTVLVAAVGFVWGSVVALSLLLGGLVSVLPNAYFAYRLFARPGVAAARSVVQDFYRGAAGKFVLTIVLFALVFSCIRTVSPLALFVAFILVNAVHWLVPVLLRTDRQKTGELTTKGRVNKE